MAGVRIPPAVVQVALLMGPAAVYLAALRPGLMSADSLASWSQIDTGDWVDVHPPAYTGLMWLSAKAISSPFLLTVGQTIFVVTGLRALASSAVAAGANRRWMWALTGCLVVSPMFGAFTSSLWKDVPYTGAFLWFVAHLVRYCAAAQSDDRPAMAREIRWLAAWGGLLVLFRQNGIVVAVGVLMVLALLQPAVRRACAAGVVVLGVAVAVVKLAVYPALGVEEAPPYFSLFHVVHDIAAVVANSPGGLDRDDRELVHEMAPVGSWRARYSCSTVNPLLYGSDLKIAEVGKDRDRVVGVWIDVLRSRPWTVLGNRLCVSSHAWDPLPPSGELYTVSHGIDDNPFGLRLEPVPARLGTWVLDAVTWTDTRPQKAFLWRAPPWLYLLYAVLAAGVVRARRARPWLFIALPFAVQQFAYLLISPAQDTRYMFPALIGGVVLLPLAWSVGTRRQPVS